MQGWCRQPNDVGSNSWQDSTVTELSIARTAAQYVDGDDDGDGDCGDDGDDDGDGDGYGYGYDDDDDIYLHIPTSFWIFR